MQSLTFKNEKSLETHLTLGDFCLLGGVEVPVEYRVVEKTGESRRCFDNEVFVLPPRFQNKNLLGRVRAQPVCEQASSSAASNDNVVILSVAYSGPGDQCCSAW